MVGLYARNKIVSLGAPFLILIFLLGFYSSSSPQLWWILIVTAHTFGYVHFILGYFYQAKGVARKNNFRLWVWLGILTVGGISISLLGIVTNQVPLLSIFAIGYFLVHGALNETTLMQQQLGYAPKRRYMVPLAFYIFPFFLLSLTHPSFFFTPTLEFLNPPPTATITLLEAVITIDFLQGITLVSFLLFFLAVPARLFWSGRYLMGLSITVITGLTVWSLWFDYPLNYAILYFVALSFHFISWSYFFFQKYTAEAPDRVPRYLRDHACILVPLFLLSVTSGVSSQLDSVHEYVFNGVLFVTFAMIHNTTSLLNEDWFKRLVGTEP
jgi:hypothetical protein